MAANYNDAVVTISGIDLVNAAVEQEKPIIFTKIAIGSGKWNSHIDLRTATALIELKNNYTIVSKIANENQYKLKALISNYDPDTGESVIDTSYSINEIGIFAKLGTDGAEILYAIITAESIGDVINVYDGTNPSQIAFTYVTTLSDKAEITLNLTGAYALADDLETTQGSLSQAQSEMDLLSTSASELSSIVGSHASSLSALTSAESETASQVENLSSETADFQNEIDDIEDEITFQTQRKVTTFPDASHIEVALADGRKKEYEFTDDAIIERLYNASSEVIKTKTTTITSDSIIEEVE